MALCEPVCAWGRVIVDSVAGLCDGFSGISGAEVIWGLSDE